MPADAPGPSGESHLLPPPPLALVALRGPAAGRTLAAAPGKAGSTSLVLGRKATQDIHVPDPSVSERHAIFEYEPRPAPAAAAAKKGRAGAAAPAPPPLTAAAAAGGVWTIRDLGSSNGTTRNGEEVVREGASHDLEEGDVLYLGNDTVAVVTILTPLRRTITARQAIDLEVARLEKHAAAHAAAAKAELAREMRRLFKKVATAAAAAGVAGDCGAAAKPVRVGGKK